MGSYRESLFGIIGIHVAAVLPIVEHFELQIILVDRAPLVYPIHLADMNKEAPLVYPIHLADMNKECYCSTLRIGPDLRTPVLTHMIIEPRSEVRPTGYLRASIKCLLL
jgi:hypothetical protein